MVVAGRRDSRTHLMATGACLNQWQHPFNGEERTATDVVSLRQPYHDHHHISHLQNYHTNHRTPSHHPSYYNTNTSHNNTYRKPSSTYRSIEWSFLWSGGHSWTVHTVQVVAAVVVVVVLSIGPFHAMMVTVGSSTLQCSGRRSRDLNTILSEVMVTEKYAHRNRYSMRRSIAVVLVVVYWC